MHSQTTSVQNLDLPWSNGSLSAKLWAKGRRVVVGVPELDVFCTGKSQSEAVFRFFSLLVRYYQQLKQETLPLSPREEGHRALLAGWIAAVEKKMTLRELTPVR